MNETIISPQKSPIAFGQNLCWISNLDAVAAGDWWQPFYFLSHIYHCWVQWFVMNDGSKSLFSFCQNLHQDIESQNERIKTILELCATVDAQYAKRLKRRRLKPPPSHQKCSVLLSVGKIIEERWHCLWLRSLEWQCFLEQFTHHKSKVRNQVFHMGKTNHLSAIFWGRYLSSNNPPDEPFKRMPFNHAPLHPHENIFHFKPF